MQTHGRLTVSRHRIIILCKTYVSGYAQKNFFVFLFQSLLCVERTVPTCYLMKRNSLKEPTNVTGAALLWLFIIIVVIRVVKN